MMEIATFQINVTPPIGSPLCDGLVPPAAKIDDPLFARGVVILGAGDPIVLCAVDFTGIGNAGFDVWRETLAKAASTSPGRVALHTVHQHDAPSCDLTAEELLVPLGIGGAACDVPFIKEVLERLGPAVERSLDHSTPFTHVGTGWATIERVASNRRILGYNGKVKIVRFSASRDRKAIAAPEGTIDPELKSLSFWNDDTPLVSMSYYATHPQSFYGLGAVSADFVGLARAIRDRAEPAVFHMHFNGAAGNIAAGKYNDGSPGARCSLTERLASGMRQAMHATKRFPISVADLQWRSIPVVFPLRDRLTNLREVERTLRDETAPLAVRATAARDIVYARRVLAGNAIDVTCLRLGNAALLHLPAEVFVEYQLAAQQLRPDLFVCTAGYGDYGPGYIGTTVSYSQGGYETGPVSRTAPEVEGTLMDVIRHLLES
jgi:hypothetical protein